MKFHFLYYKNNLQFHLSYHIFHHSSELNDRSGLKNKIQNMFLSIISLYRFDVINCKKYISDPGIFFDLENQLHQIL